MHIWWVSYRFLFFLCRFESLDSTTSIVRFSFFFQYGVTSNKSSSLTLISNSFPHFLLASLSPFIHIYWCLLDGNIWSWRLMALYISLKKGKEKTLHTSSELHLFPICFFSADCFFFWTFSSSLSFFFPSVCHFNRIHHQRSSLFMSARPWKCFRFSFKLVSRYRILFKFCDGNEWWIRKKIRS